MVKNNMYQEIKKMKQSGKSKNYASLKLNIDIKTVRKYWNMNDGDYQKSLLEFSCREKEFETLKKDILDLYKKNDFIRLNMSAVYDYLTEVNGELPANENTLRNFIHYLIESGQLSLNEKRRLYNKVPEAPYGKQLQLDFGQYRGKNGRRYYIFAAVLSASRFKYASLQEKPFRTKDLINHLLDCFAYIGGVPEELVIDQDCTMVVSENAGDIIYTKDFQYFIEEMGLKMFVCRAADPESKGKIENLVKFIKYSFFPIREFNSVEEGIESLLKWLERKANGKISQANMKIPKIEIETEKQYLRPLRNSIFLKDSVSQREERIVSDKCRIAVESSQYEVPSLYRNGKVNIYKTENKLFIFDKISGNQISEFLLSVIPGQIVAKRSRDMGKTINALKEEVFGYFDIPDWKEFLERNFKKFNRYVRDQCLLARKYFQNQPIDDVVLLEAILNCMDSSSYSMKDLWDNYQNCINAGKNEKFSNKGKINNPLINPNHYVEVAKPDISKYQKLCDTIGGQS